MALCDCEVYEICPSCAPDEPTYAKAAAARDEALRCSVSSDGPYKGPINVPCSACSAGDSKMEYHDHDYVDIKDRRPCQHNHGVVIDGVVKCVDCEEIMVPSVELPKKYAVAEIEALAREFADGSDVSRDPFSSPDAMKHRMYLGMFIVFLAKRERELRG